MNDMNNKKSGTILIIIGYFFSILSGFIGIICGLYLIIKKRQNEKGINEYIYKKSSRIHGWIILVVGIIMSTVATIYETKKEIEKEKTFISIDDVAGPISLRDITKTIYASDSSFSIEIPSNFVNEAKSDKKVDMYCSVLDSIEMTVTVSSDNPFDVFSPDWTYEHDTKITPRNGFDSYSTTKKFDKDKKIVFYERRDLNDKHKDVYFFAYQIGEDGRNYLISLQAKNSYDWNLEKLEKIASSLKTFR